MSVCDFYCFSSHRRLMHLLWGIVVSCFPNHTILNPLNLLPKRWFFTEKRLFRLPTTFIFTLSLFRFHSCILVFVCATLLATFLLLLLCVFITCKFHRMSHAQHRNLKAFKWFAGHVACPPVTFVLHQSKPRCQAISPRRHRNSRARARSFISLFRVSGLHKTAYIKNHLALSLSRAS